MDSHPRGNPSDAEGLPPEEGIERRDIEEGLDEDPEEQQNYTETHGVDESLHDDS
ncbi:hypothetical protein AB3X52_18685 [Nocardioides sp. DS6]|uniref:Uncharacterized protein n=1 Tax=Nocardioides eburneus TaxID=3231482 RepID=A0ABV3T4P9_9ACTN